MKVFLLLFFFCFIQPLSAFTLSNSGRHKLPDPNVTIIVATNTCTVAGFSSAQELVAMVEESVKEYWNRIPTCALEFEVGGVASIDTTSDTLTEAMAKTPVGQILVGCSDNAAVFSSSSTLGVGNINTASGDRGALLLNNRDTSFANLSSEEKLAVIAHELGHAFGLGHSGDAAALMYYSIGGKIQDKLSIDDYDACTYLYPHDAPGNCSAVPILSGPKDDNSGGGGRHFLLTFLLGLLLMGFAWKRVSPLF